VLQTGQDKSAVKLNWMASAPSLFRGRHFAPEIIVTCVRWYLRFSLSLRDLEELMAERGLRIDHTTIWRWTQIYGPEAQRRLHGQVRSKRSTWHMDETYIKVGGRWKYLFRAVDSSGATVDFFLSERRDREAARQFLQRALNHPDNPRPHEFYVDGNRSYPAALRQLQADGEIRQSIQCRKRQYANNRIESDHRHIKRRFRAMQGARTITTAWRTIQGLEAVHMIRKGQVLGITRRNLAGQAILFGMLFGL
jgi:IS6 family transposase